MRRRLPILLFCAALLGAGAFPAAAAAYLPPWEEGTDAHPFSFASPLPAGIAVTSGPDQNVKLARETLSKYSSDSPIWEGFPEGQVPDPRSVYPLSGGGILVSGGKDSPFVKEIDDAGSVVWQYRNGVDGLLRRAWSAEPATFGGRSCVLISDRLACRVFAVDRSTKEIVWQYGKTDDPGGGPDQLADPFCATQLPATTGQTDGNVLIADSQDNNRVIEVRADDFAGLNAPDHGFTAASIVWQYGVTGEAGTGPGHLVYARSPQRLPGGDTLLTDSDGARILRVSRSGDIVWSYVGGVDGELLDPNTARYVTSGPLEGTVIVTDCDVDTQRILFIDYDTKAVVETIDTRTLERPSWATSTKASSPREARLDAQGALWIADSSFGQVLRVGYPATASVQSGSLDCGEPSMNKAFTRLKAFVSDLPTGTGFSLRYSVDGGQTFKAPKPEGDGRNFRFPAATVGRRFIYRLTLTTEDRWVTPEFDALTIHFEKAKSGGGGGGGGGQGGSENNGSGVVTYPTPAAATAGGAAASGTGGGTGSYGSGSGAGTSGSGTGGSGAASSTSGAASSSASDLQPPVQSTGSGTLEEVQGYQTQGQEGVSGVPLTGAEGAQLPEPERPGPPVPVIAMIVAAAFVLAAFFLPWPVVAARLRSIADFDHVRRRRVSRPRLLRR